MSAGDRSGIEPQDDAVAAASLPSSGVTPGLYTSPDIVVDDKGRITDAVSRTRGSSQMLAQMRSGSWYPGDYVGPACTDGSTGTRGCGLWRCTQNQTLTKFGITTQLAPANDLDVELYLVAADNSSASATGIKIRLPAGEHRAVNEVDAYSAFDGGLYAWRNVTVAGAPENLFSTQITAQALQL